MDRTQLLIKTDGTIDYSQDDMEIFKLLYEEWKYRLTNLWSLTIKAATFAFALIFLPVLSESIKVDFSTSKMSPAIAPCAGICLSIIIGIFTIAEMSKIQEIKECIKENAKHISIKYDKAYGKGNQFCRFIPCVLCLVQIVLGVVILVSL